ncbi:MAG: helix-turn-helix transcriptional regulator [Clostridia bacterium]|nr:helix-turn-helix transcriptional regulator [Clostridia bacterium]
MKATINAIHVEAPRRAGEEAEFFVQSNEPNTVACTAHIHNAVELLYIKEGSYTVVLDSREYGVGVGDLILFCSNSIHYVFAQKSPVNQYYVIKIPPAFLLEFSKQDIGVEYIMRFALNREGQKNIWKQDELEQSEILPILKQLIKEHESQNYATEIAIRLKIMELLLAILRENRYHSDLPSNQTVELVYHIMLYIRNNYAEDIDEKKLAQSFGMSYSHFSRSFKRVAGMTFRKYLNITRIHKAEQILCTSRESITEIAMKCGYNSPSYFINVYRTITGKTPYQVRHRTEAKNSVTD